MLSQGLRDAGDEAEMVLGIHGLSIITGSPARRPSEALNRAGAASRSQLAHRVLHHRKVCFDVSVSGFDAFVTEPECNHRRVHPGLEQVHGSRVSNHVRRNPLTAKAWTRGRRAVCQSVHQERDAVAGKAAGTRTGKGQTAKSITEFL